MGSWTRKGFRILQDLTPRAKEKENRCTKGKDYDSFPRELFQGGEKEKNLFRKTTQPQGHGKELDHKRKKSDGCPSRNPRKNGKRSLSGGGMRCDSGEKGPFS